MVDIGAGRRQGITAHAYPDGFSAIGTQGRMSPEVIAVDAVLIVLTAFVIQFYNEGGTTVQFITDDAMVDAVVLSPEDKPAIGRKAFGFAEVFYFTIGEAAIIGQVLVVGAELYNRPVFGVTIGEVQTSYRHIVAAKADKGVAGEQYFAGLPGSDDDGLLSRAAGFDGQGYVFPYAGS